MRRLLAWSNDDKPKTLIQTPIDPLLPKIFIACMAFGARPVDGRRAHVPLFHVSHYPSHFWYSSLYPDKYPFCAILLRGARGKKISRGHIEGLSYILG